MRHLWRRKIHTESWWRNLKERKHLEDSGIDGTIILKYITRNEILGEWREMD